MSRNGYVAQKECLRKEGCFSRNGDFQTTGTVYHITTGAEHLPILSNKTLKILLSIFVFWMRRNRYFAQKEGLRKKKSEEVCCFAKGRFSYERNSISYYYRC